MAYREILEDQPQQAPQNNASRVAAGLAGSALQGIAAPAETAGRALVRGGEALGSALTGNREFNISDALKGLPGDPSTYPGYTNPEQIQLQDPGARDTLGKVLGYDNLQPQGAAEKIGQRFAQGVGYIAPQNWAQGIISNLVGSLGAQAVEELGGGETAQALAQGGLEGLFTLRNTLKNFSFDKFKKDLYGLLKKEGESFHMPIEELQKPIVEAIATSSTQASNTSRNAIKDSIEALYRSTENGKISAGNLWEVAKNIGHEAGNMRLSGSARHALGELAKSSKDVLKKQLTNPDFAKNLSDADAINIFQSIAPDIQSKISSVLGSYAKGLPLVNVLPRILDNIQRGKLALTSPYRDTTLRYLGKVANNVLDNSKSGLIKNVSNLDRVLNKVDNEDKEYREILD